MLPLLLIVLAVASSLVFGFGVDAWWGRFGGGLDVIMFARRFQWLLGGVSLAACVGIVALIASGRRRAWWLVGLGPVMALFVHRLGGGMGRLAILDEPTMVPAADAAFLNDDDWVVVTYLEGKPYAHPMNALYRSPVVIHRDFDKRMILIWSPLANRAVAASIAPHLKARDLDIVSMPANATLVYNSRRGQFISGMTGLTPSGQTPVGLGAKLPTCKSRWGRWREAHPQTLVLAVAQRQSGSVPCMPLEPTMPMPAARIDKDAARRVALIATTRPAAVPTELIGSAPVNITAGGVPLLLMREAQSGRVCAFYRQLEEDQPAKFAVNTDPRRKGILIDDATQSHWDVVNVEGPWPLEIKAVDGPAARAGRKLGRVAVDDGLPWGVVRTWFADAELVEPAKPVIAPPTPPERPVTRPARPRRTK